MGAQITGAGGIWKLIGTASPAGQTTFSFSNIPPQFTILKVISYQKGSINAAVIGRFNDDAGNRYYRQFLSATGAVVSAGSSTHTFFYFCNMHNTNFTACEAIIQNHTSTTKIITVLGTRRSNIQKIGTEWNNTTAKINKITFFAGDLVSLFSTGTKFVLLGLEGS